MSDQLKSQSHGRASSASAGHPYGLPVKKVSLGQSRRALLTTFVAAPLLPAAAAAQEPSSTLNSEAEALAQIVRIRYGKYLTTAELEEIKPGIERMLRTAETLSRVKLHNWDGPDYLFHPQGSLGESA